MRIMRNRKLWAAILACGTGTVFQLVPRGCVDYGVVMATQAFNICSVINCTGGQYFDFCSGAGPYGSGFLMDCPQTSTTT